MVPGQRSRGVSARFRIVFGREILRIDDLLTPLTCSSCFIDSNRLLRAAGLFLTEIFRLLLPESKLFMRKDYDWHISVIYNMV